LYANARLWCSNCTPKHGGIRWRHCRSWHPESLYMVASSSCSNLVIASNNSIEMGPLFTNAIQSSLPISLIVHGLSCTNQALEKEKMQQNVTCHSCMYGHSFMYFFNATMWGFDHLFKSADSSSVKDLKNSWTADTLLVLGMRFRSNGDGATCLCMTWRFIGVTPCSPTGIIELDSFSKSSLLNLALSLLTQVFLVVCFFKILPCLGTDESGDLFLFCTLGLTAPFLILGDPTRISVV